MQVAFLDYPEEWVTPRSFVIRIIDSRPSSSSNTWAKELLSMFPLPGQPSFLLFFFFTSLRYFRL